MPPRPAFVAALVLTAVGATGAVGVPALRAQADERDLARTRAAARHVVLPAGGTPSTSCHGSGLVGCWTVPAPVEQVRDDVVAAWRRAAVSPLEVVCHAVSLRTSRPGASASSTECSVGHRRDGRAAHVVLRPQLAADGAEVAGTSVAVHDGS